MVRDIEDDKKATCYWAITCFKFDLNKLPILSDFPGATFLIYQSETCSTTQRLHLQMYIEYSSPCRFAKIQKVLGKGPHFEVASSESKTRSAVTKRMLSNVYYCSKQNTFNDTLNIRYKSFADDHPDLKDFIWGRFFDKPEIADYVETLFVKQVKTKNQGVRNDFVKLEQYISQYNSYIECVANAGQLSFMVAKYKTWIIDKIASRPRPVLKWLYPTFRPWQQQLLDKIALPPSKREIMFIIDPVGASGKSELTTYLQFNHNAFTVSPRDEDTLFMYNNETIIIADCTRVGSSNINYSLLEQFKNGIVNSTKYMCCVKTCPIVDGRLVGCHIIVNMNEYPDRRTLSNDRYRVYEIDETGLVDVSELFLAAPTKVLSKCKDKRVRLSKVFTLTPPTPQVTLNIKQEDFDHTHDMLDRLDEVKEGEI